MPNNSSTPNPNTPMSNANMPISPDESQDESQDKFQDESQMDSPTLLVDPDFQDDYQIRDAKGTVRRFIQTMATQRIRLLIVIGSVIGYTFFNIYTPYYSATVVDLLWEHVKHLHKLGESFSLSWDTGLRQIVILLALYIAAGIFYVLQSFLMASFAERMSLHLRTKVAEKLQKLPLAYYDSHQSGTLMSCVTNDLDKMAEALQTGMIRLIVAVSTIIGAILVMFYFSVILTLIFLAFTACTLCVTHIVSKRTLHFAANRQQAISEMNAFVEEAYTGRIIIRAFNNEIISSTNFHQKAEKLARCAEKVDFLVNAINPGIRIVNRCGIVAIAVTGTGMLLSGSMTPGVFQAFFQYVNMAGEPVTEMSYMLNALQSSLAAVERVYTLLDEPEISPDLAHPVEIPRPKGNIAFSHVKFGYDPQKILMHDVNLCANGGEKIAIVGATGAGKTTLVNLLMRFYDVLSGTISLDGIDTKSLRRRDLRAQFGMVLQDTWLFDGTIAENIAYAKPDASRDEIIAAAKAARADFFIRTMPQGYDTRLTNDAENISIGQRQLLTIARVFLANPAMLILDEATSSVDTRTEMEITKAMKALMLHRTSFVIAHRLSTIVDANLILVMQNGNIIEQGTHAQLLSQNGAYAELYNSQFA